MDCLRVPRTGFGKTASQSKANSHVKQPRIATAFVKQDRSKFEVQHQSHGLVGQ